MQRVPPELTLNARRLRREAKQEERDLWGVLKAMRPRFTRQFVVDRYILDFACQRLRLAVELDGGHHALQVEEDAIRTVYLERSGWTVARFWNGDVRENIDGVFAVILTGVARASTHPQPPPFQGGELRSAACRCSSPRRGGATRSVGGVWVPPPAGRAC